MARRFRRAYEQLDLLILETPRTIKEPPVPRELGVAVDEFFKSMDDDFNTPAALTAYIKIVAMAEDELRHPEQFRVRTILNVLSELGGILGVLEPKVASQERVSQLANLLFELRNELRAKRDYSTADRIRDRMVKMGFLVEDPIQDELKVKRSS